MLLIGFDAFSEKQLKSTDVYYMQFMHGLETVFAVKTSRKTEPNRPEPRLFLEIRTEPKTAVFAAKPNRTEPKFKNAFRTALLIFLNFLTAMTWFLNFLNICPRLF